MTRKRQRNTNRALSAAVKAVAATMDKRTEMLLRGAITDLYEGPLNKTNMRARGVTDWPGYSAAIKHLEDWASDVGDVWVDLESGDVVEGKEPRPWVVVDPGNGVVFCSFDKEEAQNEADALSEDSEDEYEVARGSADEAGYVRVDSRDITRALFGALVSEGGMRL